MRISGNSHARGSKGVSRRGFFGGTLAAIGAGSAVVAAPTAAAAAEPSVKVVPGRVSAVSRSTVVLEDDDGGLHQFAAQASTGVRSFAEGERVAALLTPGGAVLSAIYYSRTARVVGAGRGRIVLEGGAQYLVDRYTVILNRGSSATNPEVLIGRRVHALVRRQAVQEAPVIDKVHVLG